jgi:hypothetical protein
VTSELLGYLHNCKIVLQRWLTHFETLVGFEYMVLIPNFYKIGMPDRKRFLKMNKVLVMKENYLPEKAMCCRGIIIFNLYTGTFHW